MADFSRRSLVLAGAALMAVGVGAGYLTAKLVSGAKPGAPPSAVAPPPGVAWPFFGKPRPREAPRATVQKPEGFAVWTSRLDVRPEGPSACIRLTRALDARKSYGDFVSVSPGLGHPAAVTVRGDELCVAGVGYETRTITLMHGLPAASGEVLAADADVAFQAGSRPAYVGFAGTGVILPREDGDGVGVETVNVSRLHLDVWRVPDRNLVRKEISAPDPTPEGDYEYEGGARGVGEDGRKVWSGDMAVHGQADQRATTVFPLGAVLKTLEPGAYVVTAEDASGLKGAKEKPGEADRETPARARRWIIFTDMALQAYDGSDALDVMVRSLKTARTMSGVRVALVAKDGGDLASAESDGQGRVRFPRSLLAGEHGGAAARVMAYGPKGDFTIMDLERAPIDLSNQDVTGRTTPGGVPETGPAAIDAAAAVDGFLYADRGVYRPGESLHLVALLRDRLAKSIKDRHGALVIRRPSGLEFSRFRFTASPTGAVNEDVVLPKAAPRGVWKAALEMDGSQTPSGETSFQVEDFVPQRLAVTAAAAAERPLMAGEVRQIQISARFLYGAPASSLPVRSEGRVMADPTPFPAYKDYLWGDQKTPFPEKMLQDTPSTTDGAGRATQAVRTDSLVGATQPLLGRVTTSVFEPGGRPVSEQTDLKIHLKPLYLGVKATAGSGDDPIGTFDVIGVDALGRRVSVPSAHYRLISERWDYDWYEQDGRWAWRRTSRDIPIAEGRVSLTATTPARIAQRLPWGDYRLELTDAATGAQTVIRQASGWSEPANGVDPPDSARVAAVRSGYRTGDTVEIHVEAPIAGEGQLVVATDRLITSKAFAAPKGGTTVKLRADADWGAGAYVMVTVIQPRDPVLSPKPRRALGLVYVPLESPGRKLAVTLKTPQVIDSKAPVLVPLTVKGLGLGETAHVTLAAVDEGVLRLTHFKAPDPIAWYFGKRALGLAYRDDYGRLLDPNLGVAGAVNFGGDAFGGAGLTVTPTKTVALWSGVVDTDSTGRALIRLPPGDFNGQLRLIAVAWTDKAVGAATTDLTVREPVVAELALPRFLSPGDRAQATLELNNVAGKAGTYTAAMTGGGGVGASARMTYGLAVGQRIQAQLAIDAASRPSIGAVALQTKGPGFASQHRYPIETRLGWGPTTRAISTLQKPGESFTPAPSLLAGFSPGDVAMTVSYSPFRGFDPVPIAAALSRYPYGCSEQMVSTALPLLFAADLGAVGATPQATAAALDTTVSKLLDREALDGSFGLWRVGDGEADPWLGAYIVDFLLAARAHGVAVPEDAMARALAGMRIVSKPDGFSSIGYVMQAPSAKGDKGKRLEEENTRRRSRAAAYALYVMARARDGDLARLRWFHDVGFKDEGSPLARAQVGAGLAAMGDRVRAHDSFLQAQKALGYKDESDMYQSTLRDLAGVIALAYEAGEVGVARGLQGRLENTVRRPDDLNTQEQAQLLKAAKAMLSASGPIKIAASGVRAQGAARFQVGRLAEARLVNTGAGAIWRTVTVSGTPAQPPASQSAGLKLQKTFFSLTGQAVDPSFIRQGDQIIVRLSGHAESDGTMLGVIDDPLPAGLEIEAILTPGDGQSPPQDGDQKTAAGRFAFLGEIAQPSQQEKRDDRYVAALTLSGSDPFVLAYVARAVTPGDFFLPGAEATNMYRPAVNAQTASGRMKVIAGP